MLRWIDGTVQFWGITISRSYFILTIWRIILLITSALFLSTSGLTALILAGCAYVPWKLCEIRITKTKKESIKSVFSSIVPIVIIIIIAMIVSATIKDSSMKDILEFILRSAAGVLIVILTSTKNFIEIDYGVRKSLKLTIKQSSGYKLIKLLYHILILSGLVLSIITSEIFFAFITVAGCILCLFCWALAHHYFFVCEHIDSQEQEGGNSGNPENPDGGSSNTDEGESISFSAVEDIVNKIAKRWSYKEEVFLLVAQQTILRYNVSCQVSCVSGFGSIIYTVSGRLSGQDADKAHSSAEQKLNRAASLIRRETEDELKQYRLPVSYEIQVDIGYIEF